MRRDKMKYSMENIRKSYSEKRKRFSIVNILRDKLFMPKWIRNNPEDELKVIYEDTSILFKEGMVVYASLVQANTLLFEKGVDNCPACVLFSTDKYFDDKIHELREMADHLYDYKGVDGAPENIKIFTDAITDEYERLLNIKLPYEITERRDVYYTTIMVQRSHIPGRYLKQNYFPLLIAPDKTKASIILPKHYWSKDMIERWND